MTNKLICPSCNKAHELKDYIYATDADMAFNVALMVNPKAANLVLKYTELFTPPKSALTLARRAKIIESILLEVHVLPVEQYAYGMEVMLEKHANGELQTPLKNHNYLKKVMTSYTPPEENETQKVDSVKPQNRKPLTEKQVRYFADMLCGMPDFIEKYARTGETTKEFSMRIRSMLCQAKYQEKWQRYIKRIG